MHNNEPPQEKRTATGQTILRLDGVRPRDVDEDVLVMIHERLEERGLDSISVETTGGHLPGHVHDIMP